jgi:toxin HigB-1
VSILSFNCSDTEALFKLKHVRRWAPFAEVALRKLRMLHAASVLADLRIPPGNRLEAMRGDRVGQHSIRINDQWRICFVWTPEGPQQVQIVDYH